MEGHYHPGLFVLGIVLAITAALSWGIGLLFVRLGLQGIRTSTGTLISMVSSVLLVGVLALAIDLDNIIALTPAALGWFALIGVVNYVIGRQSNYTAIRQIGATQATPLFASAPLFALILAVVFLGESVNLYIIFGTLSIMAGLVLVVTSQ